MYQRVSASQCIHRANSIPVGNTIGCFAEESLSLSMWLRALLFVLCVIGSPLGQLPWVISEKLVLWQFSQQFSAITKIFGAHEENSAPIANLDKWVFVDVSPQKNDRGPRRNGDYGRVILLRQNGSTLIS